MPRAAPPAMLWRIDRPSSDERRRSTRRRLGGGGGCVLELRRREGKGCSGWRYVKASVDMCVRTSVARWAALRARRKMATRTDNCARIGRRFRKRATATANAVRSRMDRSLERFIVA